jgi:hypothetical protein
MADVGCHADFGSLCRVWADYGAWLRHSPHQLRQSNEIVGSGSQGKGPTDAGQTTVMGLAKAGGRLGQPNTSSMRLRSRPLTA